LNLFSINHNNNIPKKEEEEEEEITMYGKVVLTFIFVFLLLISYSIFIGTLDIRSYFFQSQVFQPAPCKPDPPIRLYMYDLPPRFNVQMINRKIDSESPVTAKDFPRWPDNWGLKKQHSVEYWMMGSLIHEGDDDGESREAVRVFDPELADAFFVPFFSFRLWFGVVVTVGVGFHFHGLRVAFSGWQRSIGGYGSSG
jgi:hypothetical protein